MTLQDYLDKSQTPLCESDMITAMTAIMDGTESTEDIAQFLTTLSKRGETAEEISGAARVLRSKVDPINAPQNSLDCCGTGGDGISTYNISTAVALVAASCGVPMAKHGNRSASSKSGAADVLEALGVNLDISKENLEDALEKYNFCFLMAPQHHKAMKHVAPIRKSLGFRTIFNLLGPLANPAKTKYQLIGVYDEKWLIPMAEALDNLGTERAWLVHGHDGMDEITMTDKTSLVVLNNGKISEHTLSPQSFGLPNCKLEDLKGGEAEENAEALKALLSGKENAYRNIVLANTAAVLAIHNDKDVTHLPVLAQTAANAIDSGLALQTLQNYIAFTNEVTT
ncbi:MAG TPA: anthranilate phosphoribosyltransferase [Micavibrio sp.]|nr:anthranilate phosphoribosyltransferase [Micavibrio sp.]HIL28759.1 anthranilate phosphoribosyltransferase [Micavibrio sp.]